MPRELFVYNRSKETFLGSHIRLADTYFSRLIGLLGQTSLAPDTGLWIVPGNSIHTFGLTFPIDLVLLDRRKKVVGVREYVRPFSITRPRLNVHSLIELPAHTIYRSRTEPGDQLVIDDFETVAAAGAGQKD